MLDLLVSIFEMCREEKSNALALSFIFCFEVIIWKKIEKIELLS